MPNVTRLTIFTDGGSRNNPGQAAIGVNVVSAENDSLPIHQISLAIGIATNNEAEYQAILASLTWLKEQPWLATVTAIEWKLDSKLVVEQLSKRWKIKEPRMLALAQQCWAVFATLPCSYRLTHVLRAENAAADALVNQALDALGAT